nr:EamA family transporter [Clostridioides difficile]
MAYTCLRVLGDREDYYTIVFFFSVFSLVTVGPIAFAVYEPMTLMQLIYLLLGGVFASLGQFGITLAYKYAPAKEISIFDYSNIIFSAILSIFLFNVYPDMLSVVGYLIVFSAAFYMFLYNKKLDKLDKEKKK